MFQIISVTCCVCTSYKIDASINNIFFLLKNICGITHRIEGITNIPDKDEFIIASKHQSAFETLLLFSMFQKAIFIHKYEL